ncbi:MAG: Maf family nucleotide pyrophosphatase [Burkholderiaceae bacterium]
MIVLASTSPYRRELLLRLGRPFETLSPEVEETALPGEPPDTLASRLALAKAQAVSKQLPTRLPELPVHDALIIGSDQTATLDGLAVISKPGTHEKATAQLRQASGQEMTFFTAVAIMASRTGTVRTQTVRTTVRFRSLTDSQIEAYLRAEKPYDCAGSAKSEGLGIALLERVQSDDPTALIGLPLIAVCQMLDEFGHEVLAPA